MTRNILAVTLLVAIASFAPQAQAGYLCEDEDGELEICLKRMPHTSFIPRALPAEVPTSFERKVEKRVSDVVVAPRTADIDAKIVEVPATVSLPDVERLCSAYVPSLGEMLQLPCRD
jgi:hypothetical protein